MTTADHGLVFVLLTCAWNLPQLLQQPDINLQGNNQHAQAAEKGSFPCTSCGLPAPLQQVLHAFVRQLHHALQHIASACMTPGIVTMVTKMMLGKTVWQKRLQVFWESVFITLPPPVRQKNGGHDYESVADKDCLAEMLVSCTTISITLPPPV